MKNTKNVTFRRKSQGRTNYKKRLLLLQSRKPRLVIRKSNTQVSIQIAEYSDKGDRIVCGIGSSALKKLGWNYSCNNLPACYLAGLLLGKMALDKKVKYAIADVGLQTPIAGSRIYAAIKGVVDAGMEIPVSEEVFPAPERLSGKDIASYIALSKDKMQFSAYKKNKLDGKTIVQDFETCKKKIMKGELPQASKKDSKQTK